MIKLVNILEFITENQVTKGDWGKADGEQRVDWLLQIFDDVDEAEKHFETEWEDLPNEARDFMKISESVNEGSPGYSKFIFSLQTLIGDIAPNAWEDKSQIDSTSMKRIHNSLKKRYGDDYAKYNDLLKTQKGQFGWWYLKEPVNESEEDYAGENFTDRRMRIKKELRTKEEAVNTLFDDESLIDQTRLNPHMSIRLFPQSYKEGEDLTMYTERGGNESLHDVTIEEFIKILDRENLFLDKSKFEISLRTIFSKSVNETKKPAIVVYNGKRLAVDPGDIERLKSGKDIVGKSTKHTGQEEWISAKGKWKVEEPVNEELSKLLEKIKGIDGKACWKGYRYAGTKDGKDKCVKVNEEEVDMSINEVMDMEIIDENITEAKFKGKTVTLNKPTRGDSKKFKVYVNSGKKNADGSIKVKKVNFGHGGTSAKKAGQKTMSIRKSNPKARSAFRARHNCDSPGPKTMARYWSCKKW